MNDITKKLLSMISDISGEIKGAFNIREDGGCAGRQSTENVDIIPKVGQPGIDIIIKPNTKEKIYIPACVTKSNVDDLVYNEEKHVGIGEGTGKRIINPQTYIEMAENSYMEMDTVQIKGVDFTKRDSKAVLQANAKLVIKEKIMTHGEQYAETNFAVDLDGEDSGVDLISRSVARGTSKQMFRSVINGNTRCTGHSECDAIIMDKGVVSAIPELTANDIDAALIHEAAIGKIAGEQLIKLMTLGLTSEEAEAKIVEGFLK